MRLWFLVICLSWGLLLSDYSRAAGFDCPKARTGEEKGICADQPLSMCKIRVAALEKQAGRGPSAPTMKQAEDRLVKGGYLETLMNANWAVEQGAPVVPILDRMLGRRLLYEEELGGATGAFPFNALWALAHIPQPSALKVLEKYAAADQDPGAVLAVKGWKLRAEKKAACYGVLSNDAALLERPSADARVVKQLKAGQAVRIERTMIANPGEEGARGGPAHYDQVKLLPGGEQGYIGRAGDDFSPFM
jgi:hypothetical protein